MQIEYLYNTKGNKMDNCILVHDGKHSYFFSYNTLMFTYYRKTYIIKRNSTYRSNTTSRQMNSAFKALGLNITAKEFYSWKYDQYDPITEASYE